MIIQFTRAIRTFLQFDPKWTENTDETALTDLEHLKVISEIVQIVCEVGTMIDDDD